MLYSSQWRPGTYSSRNVPLGSPDDPLLQPRAGVDRGPIHLVNAGLVDQLKELGWQVKFDGHHQFEDLAVPNDTPIGKLKNPRTVSRVCQAVAEAVGGHAKAGQLPLTLGGDHSLAMGTISGTLECVHRVLSSWSR